MADRQLFTNNAVSLLATPITSSATSLTVMAGHGALYPQPTLLGDFFLVTLENEAATVREIVKVTARTGDTLTIVRGQEGTTPVAWASSSGNDTLVDHRITAETIRQAMLLPEPTGGGGSVPGSSTNAPINIDPGWTVSTSTAQYGNYQRGFKYFVTLYMPSNHLSCTFEVLGNISGNISTNEEIATWNRTARVGYNFAGTVQINLNKITKEIELTWQNGEGFPVEVMCTRIQHQA